MFDWFNKKGDDFTKNKPLDEEFNKVCDEVAPTIKPEEPKKEEKKKLFKISLHIVFKNGTSMDYWFNDVAEDKIGHNGRQWFKGFFRWWFHRPEEHSYYQEVNKGGVTFVRNKINYFEVKVVEQDGK